MRIIETFLTILEKIYILLILSKKPYFKVAQISEKTAIWMVGKILMKSKLPQLLQTTGLTNGSLNWANDVVTITAINL